MKLTAENYYSAEMNKEYMSVSQWKDFHGCPGLPPCEARALAKMNGLYNQKTSNALLIGSYVDAYFEGTLSSFILEHPEIFTKASLETDNPELLAIFKNANVMIERCERDPLFMGYMSGNKQTILTAELFGIKWKIKIDSYAPGGFIVDLKTAQDIRKIFHVKDTGYVNFVEYYGYVYQLAIYQKVTELATGEKLPCFIAAVSKQEVPDIELIWIPDEDMEKALQEIELSMPTILELKDGTFEPCNCGICDYCKESKVLTKAISYHDILCDVT